ncbi:MAG: 4-alpha-glucanotransferase, partial [bacterium]
YSGTHDNKTLWQWYQDYWRENADKSLSNSNDLNRSRSEICWNFIEKVFASPACKAIIPIQDYLYLGKEGRMNIPGTARGNWEWRFNWRMIPGNLAEKIEKITVKNKRD